MQQKFKKNSAMKNLFFAFLVLILTGCNSQNKFSDYDYSYSRSGGFAPIYENLLIKGNTVHYSFEGQGKKINKSFKISDAELNKIQSTLTQNNFRTIEEDYKKVYDNISTSINVKVGANSASKSDASFIMKKDEERWNAVVRVFHDIINSNADAVAVD